MPQLTSTNLRELKPMKPKKSLKSYIYERDGRRCHFCDKRLQFHQASLDHYLPRSKGGTNDIFNLILSCKKCNKLKKSSIPNDFEQVMIQLFKAGVRDGVVKTSCAQFSSHEIQSIVESVDRLEGINSHVVFQGKNYRLYVKENRIVKVVHLGTQPHISE
ncbi:MAG: HNH endonuclease [Clostridia bacterium]|uniref:HNH endonuclease n=1 Tax=Caldicoprobacter sp. TaxID=2004500 RepID=UPI00396D2F2A